MMNWRSHDHIWSFTEVRKLSNAWMINGEKVHTSKPSIEVGSGHTQVGLDSIPPQDQSLRHGVSAMHFAKVVYQVRSLIQRAEKEDTLTTLLKA